MYMGVMDGAEDGLGGCQGLSVSGLVGAPLVTVPGKVVMPGPLPFHASTALSLCSAAA